MKEENPNAFKLWINASVVERYFKLTSLSKSEVRRITVSLQPLELRARVKLIARELRAVLPDHFPKALAKVMQIARAENLDSFALWPATEFIQLHGLDHIDESLEAMHELTQRFTAEFCIRPFINKHGDLIYRKIMRWARDPNEHVRRLLSEGTRPRLPWGEKLTQADKDPRRSLEILELLKFDESLYVRKSVGNHLNDISKNHPDVVVKTLQKWRKQVSPRFEKEFKFICNRALRTLIKDGHQGALAFAGVELDRKKIASSPLKLKKSRLQMGEHLEMTFSIRNPSKKKIRFIADYVIYFMKSDGELTPKVFKLKSGLLEPGMEISILKKHAFRPITTRKYYAGEHRVAIKLNGQELNAANFYVTL